MLRTAGLSLPIVVMLVAGGCLSAQGQREQADRVAADVIEDAQVAALGRTEPFTIERPGQSLRRVLLESQGLMTVGAESDTARSLEEIEHWPADDYLDEEGPADPSGIAASRVVGGQPLVLSLVDALTVAAANSRDYQSEKERVFLAALALDLERDEFRGTLSGLLSGTISSDRAPDPDFNGLTGTGSMSFEQRLKNGMSYTAAIGVDVVRLLNGSGDVSSSLFADLSVTIPLLRGAGEHIVGEPLKQAERDTIYAIWEFERFKREFAVDVASRYLNVLQQQDQVENARQNYESLITSARQLRRLADAGRRSEVEVDQAVQNELQARDRWVSAQQGYDRSLDAFRITLGLPTDALVVLDREELSRLGESVRAALGSIDPEALLEARKGDVVAADAPIVLDPPSRENAGPFELLEEDALAVAFGNRLDLRVSVGGVYDSQRGVVVAADGLLPELTLFGSADLGNRRSLSQAVLADSRNLLLSQGSFAATLTFDPGFERTAERNRYRQSLIALEAAVRRVQALEDQIKLDIRDRLRTLLVSREGLRIQAIAVALAERRVDSTRLFLERGDAQTRDLLEAQDDLITAQNALTAALVDYRVAELQLQRDMGVLNVDERALWTEFDPKTLVESPPAETSPTLEITPEMSVTQ